jgi:D-lactate dehydrogenase (cytochrome)
MLSNEALQGLYNFLERRQVIVDPAELVVYEVDAASDRGKPDGVVMPESAEQVERIVAWAGQHKIPLISRGAGTGLSGGAVAESGGLIVEFSRFNHILEIDRDGGSAWVEPGVISQTLDDRTRALGLYYPADPSSGRSSTLGGNVAENAGGPHCFKYGVTTNYITGLDVLLADGQRVRMGGRANDYPEYDFSSLITGSEGTLGLITGIYTRLIRQPAGVKTLMAAFDSVAGAGRAVSAVIAAGLTPATMELMDQKITRIVEDFAHPGLPVEAGALLILEVDGYPESLTSQMDEVAAWLEKNGAFGLRIAKDNAERERIWFGRKSAVGALARLAPSYLLLDGTVPRSRMGEALEATNAICDEYGLRVGYVAHAGDGNLHPLILLYPADADQVARVRKAGREFMQAVTRLGGSITGEHGVGIEKRPYLDLMYGPGEIAAMLEIKRVFDAQQRLNPGKIFADAQIEAPRPDPAEHAPGGRWRPANVEEASAGLARLSAEYIPVWIRSASIVEETPAGGVTLDTGGYDRLVTLAADDLYVTAGAGMRLADLQAELAKSGKWVPVAAPYADSTLGGLLSANFNGPLRMRYGNLRDQALALTFVLGDGRVVHAGRPVVKNVAGYDLCKVVIGARGTLGLITEVTFKFAALPRRRASLVWPVDTLEHGLAWGQLGMAYARCASAVVYDGGLPGQSEPFAPARLIYTAEGQSEDVQAELALVEAGLRAAGAPQPQLCESYSGTEAWQEFFKTEGWRVRVGLAPKDLAGFALSQATLREARILIDFAAGFVYAAGKQPPARLDCLRQSALELGGYLIVLADPDGVGVDRWGYRPQTLNLMHHLKSVWDPAMILNRGEFLAELG